MLKNKVESKAFGTFFHRQIYIFIRTCWKRAPQNEGSKVKVTHLNIFSRSTLFFLSSGGRFFVCCFQSLLSTWKLWMVYNLNSSKIIWLWIRADSIHANSTIKDTITLHTWKVFFLLFFCLLLHRLKRL